MTFKNVIEISAVGTRGLVKGVMFKAKQDKSNRYVLNKKSTNTNPTNKAINKRYTNTLTEAANLLATDDYLINLVSSSGQRALREFKTVKVKIMC